MGRWGEDVNETISPPPDPPTSSPQHRSEFAGGADSWWLEKFRGEQFCRSVVSCVSRLPFRFDGAT